MVNKKFEKTNFIMNILFIILISLSLINQYIAIGMALIIIYGLLAVWLRINCFNSSREWPSLYPILSLIMSITAYMYVRIMGMELINNYIKYIIFICVLVIYVLMYLITNKKIKI